MLQARSTDDAEFNQWNFKEKWDISIETEYNPVLFIKNCGGFKILPQIL